MALTGSAVSNVLTGSAQADTLNGLAGNDTLAGGAGADAYLFARGSGVDTVVENDATTGVVDYVQFAAEVLQANVTFARVGNNLEAAINGTADKLVLQDWALGAAFRVEEYRFGGGTTLSDAQVQGMVQAMAAFAAPSASTGDAVRTADIWMGMRSDLLAPSSLQSRRGPARCFKGLPFVPFDPQRAGVGWPWHAPLHWRSPRIRMQAPWDTPSQTPCSPPKSSWFGMPRRRSSTSSIAAKSSPWRGWKIGMPLWC